MVVWGKASTACWILHHTERGSCPIAFINIDGIITIISFTINNILFIIVFQATEKLTSFRSIDENKLKPRELWFWNQDLISEGRSLLVTRYQSLDYMVHFSHTIYPTFILRFVFSNPPIISYFVKNEFYHGKFGWTLIKYLSNSLKHSNYTFSAVLKFGGITARFHKASSVLSLFWKCFA